MAANNVAGNEDIRHRWNGHLRNREQARVYKNDSTWRQKMREFLFAKLPESKLHKYAQLIELTQTIELIEKAEERQSESMKFRDTNPILMGHKEEVLEDFSHPFLEHVDKQSFISTQEELYK